VEFPEAALLLIRTPANLTALMGQFAQGCPVVAYRAQAVALAGLAACMMATPAAAELQISAYLGTNLTHSSDVTIVRPGGTNVTFNDVGWDGNSFEMPPLLGREVDLLVRFVTELRHRRRFHARQDL
jgi:hypothetical protein